MRVKRFALILTAVALAGLLSGCGAVEDILGGGRPHL